MDAFEKITEKNGELLSLLSEKYVGGGCDHERAALIHNWRRVDTVVDLGRRNGLCFDMGGNLGSTL